MVLTQLVNKMFNSYFNLILLIFQPRITFNGSNFSNMHITCIYLKLSAFTYATVGIILTFRIFSIMNFWIRVWVWMKVIIVRLVFLVARINYPHSEINNNATSEYTYTTSDNFVVHQPCNVSAQSDFLPGILFPLHTTSGRKLATFEFEIRVHARIQGGAKGALAPPHKILLPK